jgi:hypothetical protein
VEPVLPGSQYREAGASWLPNLKDRGDSSALREAGKLMKSKPIQPASPQRRGDEGAREIRVFVQPR